MILAEIVTVGDELLDGRVLDTNARKIALFLADRGIQVARHLSIGDREGEIARAILEAAGRCDLVITTGGLGPTEDDRTRHAVAAATGADLAFHEDVFARIEALFRARGMPVPASNRLQALFPAGAEVLENGAGSAPGFAVRLGRARVLSAPGVPSELDWMLRESIDRWIRERGLDGEAPRIERFRLSGLSESAMQDLLDGAGQRPAGLVVRDRVDAGEIDLELVLPPPRDASRWAMLDGLVKALEGEFGESIVSRDGTTLVEALVRKLVALGRTLSVAESCTGGLIGHLITEVPGASAVFVEGTVAYSNPAKVRSLGVPEELLAAHGAVSEEVVKAMARGALERTGSDFALATSGILGPGGATPGKPVGLVWTALAGREPGFGPVRAWRREFPGPRSAKKVFAAKHALDRLRRALLAARG
ncbi:MAG: CinA family nicotinamide mononucleotide deamidase-related protein [Planctomycetes bacterium]|nr:CinA family nicotinamide mononucleotide deamidase-related protein [Planctomycetota bacterium]